MEALKSNILNNDVTFCSSVLSISNLLEEFNFKISRSEIRNSLKQYEKYPNISLQDLSDFFENLCINTGAFKVDIEFLQNEDMYFPAVFIIPNKKKKTSEFCVLKEVNNNIVKYYSPSKGDVLQNINELNKLWNNILFFLEVDDNIIIKSNEIAHNYDEENEALLYLKTIDVKDNFFNNEICDYIINYCEEKKLFERSMVTGTTNKHRISSRRTSFSSFIKDREDTIFKEIYKTISDLLKVPEDYIENLQCVRYSKGQEFNIHFDPLYNEGLNNRHHTLLLYLNDNFNGGETFFPELNLKIIPEKGRLLHFKNKDQSGNNILFSSHAGLPVDNGIKYACNIWVKDNITI